MQKTLSLNSNQLHIIAAITMLIDHAGYIFFPSFFWMRMIGRLAFPIYAFLLTEGFHHTKNIVKYGIRLFVFALITEPAFDFAFYGRVNMSKCSVLWTLLFGLIVMCLIEKLKAIKIPGIILSVIIVGAFCFLADTLGTDYGKSGLLVILVFYFFKGKTPEEKIVQTALLGIICNYFIGFVKVGGFSLQLIAILALPLIWMYNGEKGKSSKPLQYFFYAFYPVHLAILYFLAIWIYF